MKAFIGVVINMDLNPKTDLYEYFSEESVNKYPFVKSVFSKERFMQIYWMLYTPITVERCRGRKIKSLTDYIDRKCRELYIPSRNIAIDESTIGFMGRVNWKCYNPKKSMK